MRLDWKGAPGKVIATGHKGTYTIQTVARVCQYGSVAVYVLHGVGHDGLSVLHLPVLGKSFETVQGAQEFAQGLDDAGVVEAEMSGT